MFERSLILGAFTETYLKKYFSTIVHIGQNVSDCLVASPVATASTSTSVDEAACTAMYSYTRDAVTGRVLVTDVLDLFSKVTYEVLAHTVMGSEWMALMPSFGECSALQWKHC